jgi:CRISPR-associated Csx3 family protein
MKLLTFLGTGNYTEVQYKYEEQTYKTKYAPLATAYFIKPNEIILFLTKEAKSKHLEAFEAEVKQNNLVQNVFYQDIPLGFSEEERWDIWEKVIQTIKPNDEISFDLTHSFRLIPFYTFLAVQFAKFSKNVKLDGIFYGAFEHSDSVKPLINIKEAFDIADWLYFTAFFKDTGIFPRKATALIKEQHNNMYKQKVPNPPRIAKNIADKLIDISQTISVSNVVGLPAVVNEFIKTLAKGEANKEFPIISKPLSTIFQDVEKEYKGFATFTQDQIIEWLIEHGHITQSILAMRERIIDFFIEDKKKLDEDERDKIANSISELTKSTQNTGSPYKIINLWNKISQLRNGIAHCGYKENVRSAKDAIEDTKKYFDELKNITGNDVSGLEPLLFEPVIESVKFTIEDKEKYVSINIELIHELTHSILKNIKPPDLVKENLANKGVVLNGRAPIWLYGFLIHFYHPTKFVAVYDPRINGAVIVQSHSPEYSVGTLIEL